MDSVPMTHKGYAKLKAQLDQWENTDMPEIAERIAEARAEGDLKENAEYHAQRERQGQLQAQITELKDRLARAQVITPSDLNRDGIVFGATIKVMDLDLDDEETFTLVGEGEEDYDSGKILVTSPFAQGLLGKKVGDKVTIEVPAGEIQFKILEVTYEDE